MSLPESTRDHAGRLLYFEPWHGWGWFRLGADGGKESIDYGEVDRAGAFRVRVRRFFTFEGELRGIVGRVEQAGHLFDGLWAATWTMLVGEFDLTDNLCWRWDIELGPGELVVVPRGVEHRTAADEEAEVILLEPAGVLNTGSIIDEKFTAPMCAKI